MMDCAPHHREPAMTPTRCQDCGEPLRYSTGVALCPGCCADREAEERRAYRRKFDAALAALDRIGEGGGDV